MLLPSVASADANGTCGDNLTWTYVESTGTLTISGTGAMLDYTYDSPEAPWSSYSIKKVILEEGIASIGGWAFYNCSGLTSITIPNSVTSIGDHAFYGCSGLTSINIPNSVEYISIFAFWSCSGLTSITVDIGNTTYDSRNNCNAIIETATNTLMVGCKNSVILNSVTRIGYEAFFGCKDLTSITIPNSVTSIGMNAFQFCEGLTSITIPNSVKHIDVCTFYGCSGLTSITVDTGNTTYDSRENCNAIIETATNTLIAGCKNTIIPNSVTSIGNNAFDGCSGLSSVTIPNSVTSIGGAAFGGCSSLTSVTIPNSVTSIDGYAFEGCNKLATVISQIAEPFNIVNNVYQAIANGATLYVPAETKAIYQATSGWNEFTNIKEFNSVTLAKDIVSYTSVVALDFTEPVEGLKAYAVSEVTDGKAVLTEVTGAVPAGTGLILKGTAGQTYTIPYTTEEPAAITNKLVGVTVDTEIGGNDLDYILKDGKFVKASAGMLSAGKAYLKLDAALARGVVEIDGDATGVGAVLTNSEKVKSEVYNLQGQRIGKPAKGLYVVDGKKIFVK